MQRMSRLVVLFLLSLLALPVLALDDETEEHAEWVRANYTKYEYRIPMRDGARLFTAVYIPREPGSYPFLMTRTPYRVSPYGADEYRDQLGPQAAFDKEKFIFVYQDVRGRFRSEGSFVNMRPHIADKHGSEDVDESSDTYDTIAWLLENIPGNNGKVGQWGNSYPGFYTSAGAIDSHPALKAISPQAPIADWWWDDMHRHGAFNVNLFFNFFSNFGVARPEPIDEWPERFDLGTPDGFQFFLDLGPLKNINEKYFHGEIEFWNQVAAHPNRDDFWKSRNILPHLKNIGAAVMVVGGWFDTEDLYGPLNTYRSIEEKNPGTFNVLVMGPWSHGAWNGRDGDSLGNTSFSFKTAETYREQVLEFFKHFLKEEGEHDLPEALVFETGANRWHRLDAWPPPDREEKAIYLRGDGHLTLGEPPTEDGEAFDEYISDPAKPVPYTTEITKRWARDYMVEDQRFAARRPDVLTYDSDVLKEDLTLAGPLEADLWVSTSGTDADFVVKIIDHYPPSTLTENERRNGTTTEQDLGNRMMLVRGEVFRARFRESYEEPKPFVPGEVARVRFFLNDLFHTFRAGHRISIQIQSSWFPFVDRNPQTFVPNIYQAEESDFIKATHRIHRSKEHPSAVRVGTYKPRP